MFSLLFESVVVEYLFLSCELFLWYGWLTKRVYPYFQWDRLSEILTITNLQHAVSRIWTSAEPEFRLCWMKVCSSDSHYTSIVLLKYIDEYKFCILDLSSLPTSWIEIRASVNILENMYHVWKLYVSLYIKKKRFLVGCFKKGTWTSLLNQTTSLNFHLQAKDPTTYLLSWSEPMNYPLQYYQFCKW